MKQQRSSEESEPGNGRDAASGETAPDSAQGSGPGSIGAPSAPASRTATQGRDTSVVGDGDGGGARTPTSSAPGPEQAGEREAGAPAAVHAVGVSIGRTTAGAEEQPEGSDAAAVREEAAETAGGSTVAATATAATAAGAVPAAEATTANSAEETAEAKTVAPAAPAGAAAAAGAPEAAAATKTAATESGATKTGSASQEAAETAGAGAAEAAASGATATATATATVAASPPDSASATEGGAPERPGRVSRPMVVAAAFAGALLLGAPFVVAGAQKDDGKPTRGEAAAAAWKQDGQEGGYVPGTDPAGPDGVRAPGSPQQGVPPVRGDKGPANRVRADAGDGPQRANGSPETERGDGAKGSTGTGGTTDKSGSSAKAPAGTGSEGSAKAPSAETAPQSQPKTTPKVPTVVYSGVSGPECPTQRFQRDGYYSDGKEGWATHSGGFGGYGCAGKYLSMPMSGSSSKDTGGSATWLFDLPASAKKCSISVHVPGSSDIVRVGGDPSYYTVYDRFLPRTNNLVGSFYVNQQDRRGTWYNVPGTFAVDAKKLSVRIHDRGRDSKYEHHAISTVKAICTG